MGGRSVAGGATQNIWFKENEQGGAYLMKAAELHTIRIVENETVLALRQFEDVVPHGQPTQTFTRGAAPSLDGLYSKFTADQALDKLRLFRERTGYRFETA